MNKIEYLKAEIEKERKVLDEMLGADSMQDVLIQSRKLDRLMEEYIRLND